MTRISPRGRWAIVLVLLCAPLSAIAHWMMPTDAPVARLVNNISAYVKKSPQDPEGHYVLGRVHSLAFTLRTETVGVWERDYREPHDLPKIVPDDFQRPWSDKPTSVPQEELVHHLGEAVKQLQAAIDLDKSKAHYHLTLAYTLDRGSGLALQVDTVPGAPTAVLTKERTDQIELLITKLGNPSASTQAHATADLTEALTEAAPLLAKHRADPDARTREAVRKLLETHWRETVIREYLTAYELAIAADLKIDEQPLRGLQTLIGYEAGKSYLNLVRARGVKDSEKAQAEKVAASIKTLEKKPPNGAITPIILSLSAPAPLSELIDNSRSVCFDLDGTGRPQCWSWVKPGTGLLAWDPAATGRITSGRNLFGNATWWMFFSDGYHALDALDDNRDGFLSGPELRGLAVWFDLNSNGISDPGEVIPVERLGIERIATHATSTDGESPANREGVWMTDGRRLPTYDWIARGSVEPEPAR